MSNGSPSPVYIYNTSLIPLYQQLLLTEKDNCPLSWENAGGYIQTNPQSGGFGGSGDFNDDFNNDFYGGG
jgi:hypothetical protein